MNNVPLNYDIAFIAIIALSTIFALFRGAIIELLNLSAWIIAIYSISKFGPMISRFIPANITNPLVKNLIAFIIIFILLAIIISLLKKVLTQVIDSIGLGTLNYLLGALFGIIRGVVICSIIILLLEVFNVDTHRSWQRAKIYPLIFPVVVWLSHTIPERLNGSYDHNLNIL